MTIDLKNVGGLRAAVVGAGVSGLSAARLLRHLGAEVSLFDEKEAPIADNALEAFDLVVLSPGFARRKPCIAHALRHGVLVVNEIDIAAPHLSHCRFIGVTGTNGKSTTTAMIGDILKRVDAHAFVGGNLGKPLCDAVFDGDNPRMGVVELSSYQLETLQFLRLDVAVVTHLTPDHLDRYDSVEDYYGAKNRIFSLLKEGGVALLNGKDAASSVYLHPAAHHLRLDFNQPLHFELPNLVGAHNLENAAAAYAATKALGIDEDNIIAALKGFRGLAHRLEFLGEAKNIRWYNDSKATNVESALIAVKSFDRGVHLIVGGLGKGASYEPLVNASEGRVARVYAIGQDAPVVEEAFGSKVPVAKYGTLDVAVANAMESAQPGDTILLAPACASFDQYASYVARGDHLRQLFRDFEKRER